jgi:hypothetical protein
VLRFVEVADHRPSRSLESSPATPMPLSQPGLFDDAG